MKRKKNWEKTQRDFIQHLKPIVLDECLDTCTVMIHSKQTVFDPFTMLSELFFFLWTQNFSISNRSCYRHSWLGFENGSVDRKTEIHRLFSISFHSQLFPRCAYAFALTLFARYLTWLIIYSLLYNSIIQFIVPMRPVLSFLVWITNCKSILCLTFE